MGCVLEYVEALAPISVKYRWLLENGREWTYEEGPLPDDVRRGPWRNCFENAGENVLLPGGMLAETESAYRYVEGTAWCGSIPAEHAWLVDENDRVIDPTWIHDGICGFCLGNGELPGECECEDANGDCWGCEPAAVTCWQCEGSGESEERDTSEREYFGVVIEADDLRRHIVRTGTWGCLSDAEWYENRVNDLDNAERA